MLSSLFSLFGNLADNGDEAQAQQHQQAALNAIKNIGIPSVESQQLNLDQQQSVGDLTPEMLATFLQEESGMKGISSDPRLKAQQMQALQSLIEQGNTGLSEQDKASLFKINKGVEQDAKGRNDAILQNMSQRGMGGSGAELAAQLANSQAAAERSQEAGLTTAGQAQQKALQSLSQAGQLGGQMRSQDFDQQSQVAKAQDAINQFNSANRQNVAAQNVNTRNNAQQYNLTNRQNISNANVGIRNQQQGHNQGLIQQQFNNRLDHGRYLGNAHGTAADASNKRAAETRGMWTGVGQGLDEGIAAYATSGASLAAPPKKMAHGGVVPGEQASKHDDNIEDDTVHVVLSPGEVVVPKSILNSDNDEVILSFIKAVKASAKGK